MVIVVLLETASESVINKKAATVIAGIDAMDQVAQTLFVRFLIC
jgi:hypothetical protein